MNIGVKPMPFTSSGACCKSVDGGSDQFPVGLRVLVVDDDPTCLRILEKMLKNCLYQVTTSNRAELALEFLRDNKNGYDIVISDVHMPDMDGFKLLEHVGLEMDLPVIMMSADDSKTVVMKGVTHGACDYLIKPVRMEALKNIWQHVVRKKKHEWKEKDFELSTSVDECERQQKTPDDFDYSSSANEGNWKNSKKRKDEEDGDEERDDSSSLKKPRVVWSVELHQQFVTAVNQLGIDKAVPKKILELMNVPGLTRENVASHLQKYRLYLRRLSGVPHQNGLGNSFVGPPDVTFGSINGLDLQALAASGQIPPQSLATIQAAVLGRANSNTNSSPIIDQRNVFSFENPKLRFVEGQHQQQQNNNSGNKHVNLLHGIPTNMDSKQLASLHQSRPLIGNLNIHMHSQAPMVQQQSRTQVLSRTGPSVRGPSYTSISQPSTVVDLSRSQRSDFSRMSTPISNLQDEASSEMKVSRDFAPNYDVFNDANPNRAQDWRLQNVGSAFNEISSSVLDQPGFSANQKSGQSNINISQQFNSSLADNQLRIKTERLPGMGFHNGFLPENFGQEDLMSVLLKQQDGLGHVDNEFGFDGYHLDNLPV